MRKLKLLFASLALVLGSGATWGQTDVTSTYLTNAGFEGEYTSQEKPQSNRDIYKPDGWTVSWQNGDSNDLTSLNSSTTQWNNFSEKQMPTNGGNNTYWIRYRWGSSSDIKLSQDVNLSAGVYHLSADVINLNTGSAKATISAAGKTVEVDSRNTWANYGFVFLLQENATITIAFEYKQTSGGECIAGVDNFKLVEISQGAADITSQDWTSMLANAGFERGASSSDANKFNVPYGFYLNTTAEGWKDGSINTTAPSEGSKLYNFWAGTTTALDLYQSIKLPAGKYTISADLRTDGTAKISNQGVYAKIGDDVSKSGTIETIGDPWNSAGGWNNLSKDFYVDNEGNVQLGASSTGGADSKGWFQIDNFRLLYKGAIQNTTAVIAPEVATTAVANKWYAVEISAAGEYKIISSVGNTIKYTQKGSYVPSDVTDNLTLVADEKQVVNLAVGTLYLLASADANLTVAPNVYSYSVDGASFSVADNKYTQNKTVTATFETTTNDPDGVLTLLDANKIKVNGSKAVASLSGKALTITLAETLTPSTDYIISIEAGAVGFNADNTNAAISSTVKTPLLFDGTYYLKQNDADKYISRGGDSNTEATLDNYGIAVRITTDAENVTRFTFVDNNKNLFGGSQSVYTDKNESDLGENAARARWTLAKSGDGYTLYSPLWEKYIAAGIGEESSKPAATYSDDAYAWTFETPAVHATKMAAMKDANAATVATAAGLSATTVEELKAIIEGGGWTAKDITLSEKYSSVAEKYQDMDGKYNATVVATQNLTDLENGIYKVSFNAFHRLTWNDETYNYYANDIAGSSAYLWANDQQLQFPSVMSESRATAYTEGWNPNYLKDGKNYPNSMGAAGQAFQDGKYKIELFVYVDDGKLDLGAEAPGKYANGNWICYRDLTLTRYYIPPTDAQKKDLADAIEAAEAKTLGFETGEYAPYNNVTALTKLAEAKAINPETASGAAVVAATTALANATWTVNAEELNAIYDGTFAAATNDGAPAGWTMSNNTLGGATHSRAFVGDSRLSEFNETNSAFFLRFDGTYSSRGSMYYYGNTENYVMPLKEGKKYRLTVDFAGWGSTGKPLRLNITGPTGFSAVSQEYNTNVKADTENKTPQQFNIVFTASVAGNYVINFQTPGADTNTHMVVVSNLVLKTDKETVTITDAGGYATYVSDNDLDYSSVSGLTAYRATISDKTITFNKVTTVPAGEGVLLKGAEDNYTVPVTAGVAAWDADFNAFVRGTGAAVASEADGKYNYILNNVGGVVGFYKANDKKVGTNRAYIQAPVSASRLSFVFDDEEEVTGIKTINTVKNGGAIYNLNGQRVNKAKNGLYILNGRKVMFK